MVFEKSEAVRVTVFREKQLEGNLKKSLREAVRVHRRFKKKTFFLSTNKYKIILYSSPKYISNVTYSVLRIINRKSVLVVLCRNMSFRKLYFRVRTIKTFNTHTNENDSRWKDKRGLLPFFVSRQNIKWKKRRRAFYTSVLLDARLTLKYCITLYNMEFKHETP